MSILLPAIRSSIGDWSYYVTTLSFRQVASIIKAPDEIHERKKMSQWIQRQIIDTHASAISKYILENDQRFFGSLIVGVYGGNPNWSSINIRFPDRDDISQEQYNQVDGFLGFLELSGEEKLFAIDGQHRVEGIKKALQTAPDKVSESDNISAIFVGHNCETEEGKERTRRLFTTVNKKAKAVSKHAKIALDEDDGFAILTRRLIDRFWLFEDARKHVLYSTTGSIPVNDKDSITSIVGLYVLIQDLFLDQKEIKIFRGARPSEDSLEEHLQLCILFFEELIRNVAEYREVFDEKVSVAGSFRTKEKNHLLFRPAGQRAFAKAVQFLVSEGQTISNAVSKLSKVNMSILDEEWHHILWDPFDEKMITNKVAVAEAQLLNLSGSSQRSNINYKNLEKVIEAKASKS